MRAVRTMIAALRLDDWTPPVLTSLRLLALCLALCATPAQSQTESAPQPNGEIQVEASSTESLRQDRAIEQRIRDILRELDGYQNVTVSVRAGVVSLSGRVAEPEQIRRLDELVTRVEGVVTIENDVAETTDLGERLDPAIARFEQRVVQLIAALPIIFVALAAGTAVFVTGLFLARLRRPWERLAPNEFIANIYRQLLRVIFFVFGVVVALDILGATALLGTILGAAGIVGLAIGFAVRDTVENFIASIMLSIRQPFRPNDLVEIEGDIGKVIRLTSRATILLSLDGNHIRIPNSTVFKSRIVNYSRNDERRFQFDMGVDPEADLGFARELAQQTVQALPFVLETPKALVWLENLNETGAILRVTGWILQNSTDFAVARGEAIRLVKQAIEAEGIEIPDTTYRVRLDPPPAGSTMPTPKAAGKPQPSEAVSTDVDANSEEELDRFVQVERDQTEDLLTKNAPEE